MAAALADTSWVATRMSRGDGIGARNDESNGGGSGATAVGTGRSRADSVARSLFDTVQQMSRGLP